MSTTKATDSNQRGADVATKAQETVEEVRQRAQDYFDRTTDKVKELEEKLEGVVHAHPVSSLLIAATVGATVGLVVGSLGRRSS